LLTRSDHCFTSASDDGDGGLGGVITQGVLAIARLHPDDTSVPVLGKGTDGQLSGMTAQPYATDLSDTD